MIIQYVLIIQTIIYISNSEVPESSCTTIKPFHKSDLSCGDFNDVCMKKGDSQCDNFQVACQQCPPSNFTVSMLLYLKNLNYISNRTIADFKDQISDSQKKMKTIIIFGAVFILCIIIILVLLIFYKYKSIAKCFHKKKRGKNRDKEQYEYKENLLQKGEISDEKGKNRDKEQYKYKKSHQEIDQTLNEKDETLTEEKYKSLSEQYDNINNLEMSTFRECIENINKFNKYYKSDIIDCIIKKSPINEEMKLSLNCLYVSINIISKYIEHHSPSIRVSDSSLVDMFDGFFNSISSHHLSERICESILYAMCSLMKLSENKVNKEFWRNKLEEVFLNDKISEENKLASCVILVQMDISDNNLIKKIAEYLKKIDFGGCEDYFGFSQSEISSAKTKVEKKLEILSKSTIHKIKDSNRFVKDQKNVINLISNLRVKVMFRMWPGNHYKSIIKK